MMSLAFLRRRYDRNGSASKAQLGLLQGIDPRTSSYFSSNISLTRRGLAWFNKPGLLWEAVLSDSKRMSLSGGEYIDKINSNLDAFFNSGDVHGREMLQAYLAVMFTSRGRLAMLIGGRRVGKTVVLKKMCDQFNFGEKYEEGCMVLYVDARLYYNGELSPALFMGLAVLQADFLAEQTISKEKKDRLKTYFEELYDSWGSKSVLYKIETFLSQDDIIMSKKASAMLLTALGLLCENVFDRSATATLPVRTIIRFFNSFAKGLKRYPVLIIDHADEGLGYGISESQEYLSEIVQMTRRTREMSVILTSSDQGYPRELEKVELDLFDVTKFLVAGDLSPKETWELLVDATYLKDISNNPVETKRIGMGENLARLCLAAYGGHLWTIQNALKRLSIEKADFIAKSSAPYLAKVSKCLEFSGTRPLLATMAQHGFLPVRTHHDEAKDMIVRCGLGGVLYSQACAVYHIPNTVWMDTSCVLGIIPSYGAERLSIASALVSKQGSVANPPSIAGAQDDSSVDNDSFCTEH